MPGTGLQLCTCSQSLQQQKKGISDRKPGSTLILRPVLCPSNYMCFYRKNEVEIMYLSTILKKITWKEPVKTQGSTHHKND